MPPRQKETLLKVAKGPAEDGRPVLCHAAAAAGGWGSRADEVRESKMFLKLHGGRG